MHGQQNIRFKNDYRTVSYSGRNTNVTILISVFLSKHLLMVIAYLHAIQISTLLLPQVHRLGQVHFPFTSAVSGSNLSSRADFPNRRVATLPQSVHRNAGKCN